MHRSIRLTCVTVLALMGATAQAAGDGGHFDLDLSALGDDAQGRSYDANAVLTPSARWTMTAGGGSSNADASGAPLRGTSFDGSAEVHLRSVGLLAGYSHWNDDDNFSAATPRLDLSWKPGSVRMQLEFERPRFALDYQLRILTQTVTRSFAFSGSGTGAGLDWSGEHWSGYVNAMGYSYGNELTRARAILTTPNLTRFPRLAALSGSVATLTHGALKDRASAGLQYDFTRTSLHADFTRVTDAIFETHSNSAGVGVNYVFTGLLSVDLSGGVSHAEGQSAARYASLTLHLHW
jgi:hypothetical protein